MVESCRSVIDLHTSFEVKSGLSLCSTSQGPSQKRTRPPKQVQEARGERQGVGD